MKTGARSRRRRGERSYSAQPALRLHADQRGAAALEFALIAPMLFALLMAVTETSLVFFAQEGLQTALDVAARKIMTGQAQNAGMTQAQFQQTACAALPPYLACSNLIVDAQTASSLANVNTSAPTITFDKTGKVTNSWNYSVGGAGDIVVLRLLYLWPLPTGPLGFTLNDASGTQKLLIATSVAKTEPY
jgi:Flp pilus assembly protein TadG